MRYEVKPGDTLSELAERYILPKYDWRDLQRIWRVRDARRLTANRHRSIPRHWLRWVPEEARIASVRGSVAVEMGGRNIAPAVGMRLREGARISTAANSFLTLSLSDGSRIAMPSQSRAQLVRLRKYLIDNAIDYRFKLDKGRIDANVRPFPGRKGSVDVETPISLTAVRGTEFTVSYDMDSRTAGTAVFEGSVSVSQPGTRSAWTVAERFGFIADADDRGEQVDLLPAPSLENPDRLQAGEIVSFDVTPVAGASGYYALLATDAGFVDAFAELESATPHFAFTQVPNGNLFLRVSAIGEGGLRGMRQTYSFRRSLETIAAKVERSGDGYLFRWGDEGDRTRRYRLQLFRDGERGTPVIDETGLTDTEVSVRKLPPGVYFWRVGVYRTDSGDTFVNWTDDEKLTITRPDGG
ncbi:FecR domain-containing protein [Pelagerythrobacter marensis]|uniref:FecR domain-containing protein n=1 Tax=Pelagerythrobacter marensis TaxID=543877 RepID=A0ABZ2D621_9SPHN